MNVSEKLIQMSKRFSELEEQMQDQEVISNDGRYRLVVKEHGTLSKTVMKYREYRHMQDQIAGLEGDMNEDIADPEFRALAEEEIKDLKERSGKLYEELLEAMVMDDEDSHRDAIVEIRAGTGGDEAALFAADLYRMYTKYAEKMGWKIELMDMNSTGIGGMKEVVFSMQGKFVFKRMKYESGGHRVQRVPKTETSGRIHTSACTVAVLAEAEEVDLEIVTTDLRIDTFRASGPGGQHVNKTDSAIRITHEPTGLVVSCQDGKSQHQNKVKAMRILRTRLHDMESERVKNERDAARKNLVGSGDRSQKIRTYNFPQSRVTDHRIGLSVHNLDEVLEGELDEIIGALMEYEKKQKLGEI